VHRTGQRTTCSEHNWTMLGFLRMNSLQLLTVFQMSENGYLFVQPQANYSQWCGVLRAPAGKHGIWTERQGFKRRLLPTAINQSINQSKRSYIVQQILASKHTATAAPYSVQQSCPTCIAEKHDEAVLTTDPIFRNLSALVV